MKKLLLALALSVLVATTGFAANKEAGSAAKGGPPQSAPPGAWKPTASPLAANVKAVDKAVVDAALAGKTKPNIVVIMTDNLGYGDLSIYGGMRAPTPRIDQLAGEGVRFRDFQVEPACTHTRAAFMSGRMPIRSGNDGFVTPGGKSGLDPKEVTIAEVLKGAGYGTAMYGKWHLGESQDRLPTTQGFDEWYGVTNTSIPVDPNFAGYDETWPKQQILQSRAGEEAKPVAEMTLGKRATMDRELTTKGVAYIKSQAQAKSPFFLLLTYVNPHHPNVPHPDFKGKSGGGAYADVLMEIDHNTGTVLDAIDAAGIRDDTIVVWFSDNGPTRYSPEPDHNGHNGQWSGELGSAWEGGLRTAGMMRWPGKIRGGWESDEIFHVMDLYTTLGRFGGGEVPEDRPVDGFDQREYLLGKRDTSARDHGVTFLNNKLTAVRWRQFKVHFVLYEKFAPLQHGSQDLGVVPRMYNLRADPAELYDLFGASGGTPLYFNIQRAVAPYLKSFAAFPHKDYSKTTRTK